MDEMIAVGFDGGGQTHDADGVLADAGIAECARAIRARPAGGKAPEREDP